MVYITVIVLFFTREVVKEGHMVFVAFILANSNSNSHF